MDSLASHPDIDISTLGNLLFELNLLLILDVPVYQTNHQKYNNHEDATRYHYPGSADRTDDRDTH